MLVRAAEKIKFPAGDGWLDTVLLPSRNGRRLLVIKGHSGMSEWTEGLITVPEDKIEIEPYNGHERYYLKPGNYIVKEGTDAKGSKLIKLYSAPEDLVPFFRLNGFDGFIAEDKKENEGIKTLIAAEGHSRTGYNGTRWSLAAVPNTAKIIVVNPYSYEGYTELYCTVSGEKLVEVEYYSNDKPARRTEYKNNKIHGENYPAVIEYFDDGRIKILRWYKDGKLHSEDGPAETYYYHSGQKAKEVWYKHGSLHRNNGPAEITYSKKGIVLEEHWYLNGEHHREDGPALIERYENGNIKKEIWEKNDLPDRDDGPAEVYYREDGQIELEEWFKDGVYHRENGPAVTVYYKNGQVMREEWWTNNKRHRKDGPAFIEYDENGEIEYKKYYINGNKVSEEEFMKYARVDDLIEKIKMNRKIKL
ncbi:toxin-antitoxin system YwqK family antitoxin [Thermoanaerobacter sp. RKWS2]|uniref:toxin-antitoxin system YwqK family antitoxin n=1 Tax=Thermoanaerobacter sp. RKWS2 TaxID=2983842 RepID=UPI00224A7E45|nr:hypothetical protein [Thermoanaerobacter sp. RKWS2]UZQ81796.1 hypothetical protein OEI98_001535 [Thermoanaerobacter sp. RKWS2]